MAQTTRRQAISNFAWRFAERLGAQTILFLVSLVLARLLNPHDFGVVALIMAFTSILQVFVDSGLGTALVQKKDADKLDFATVFVTNIVFCVALYGLIWLCAPLIARFYNDNNLTIFVRVLSVKLLISGIKNIQVAYISRALKFKLFFRANIIATALSAAIGIGMAYKGCGAWAIIAQQLSSEFISAIVLWFVAGWKPQLRFSWNRLSHLYKFAFNLLLSNLINRVYQEIRQLIIGKLYTPADLAFYNRSHQFPNFISNNIDSSLESVLFPILSRSQEDKTAVKTMMRRTITVSSFFMWPLMAWLVVTGEPLIRFILTDKWLPMLPYMYTFCVIGCFMPIHSANQNAIKAVGRSDIFLKTEIIKKSIGMALLLASMKFGVMAIAMSGVIYTVIASFVNARPNKKLLDYSYWQQIKDILPYALLAAVSMLVVFPTNRLVCPDLLKVLLQFVLLGGVYVLLSHLFKTESYVYLKNNFKQLMIKLKSRKDAKDA